MTRGWKSREELLPRPFLMLHGASLLDKVIMSMKMAFQYSLFDIAGWFRHHPDVTANLRNFVNLSENFFDG